MKSEPFERELSWSCSREDVFTRCRLEYWFNYYGSHGGWERDAPPLARECFTLKHTKNRYAWMGDLVHEAIQDFLEGWADGRPLSRDQTVDRAHKRMRRQYRESLEKKFRIKPGKTYNRLVEHENNIAVPDEKWKDLNENVKHCVANFFFTGFYRRFIATDSRNVVRIERLDHFFEDGIKVYAKPDVAARDAGRFLIADWKTGREDDEHEFQICYYVLYAIRKLGFPLEKIDPVLVYLKDNTEKRVEVTGTMLDTAIAHLKKIFSEMKSFDEQVKENVDINLLPKAKTGSTCSFCRFQGICVKKTAGN